MALVLGVGLALAGLVLAAGHLMARARLGADDAAARHLVETSVRARFHQTEAELRAMVAPLERAPELASATAGDERALGALFDVAAGAVGSGAPDDIAITVYGVSGEPLAWAGRPSEIPSSRLTGADGWFVTQGPLGLRLVYLRALRSATGVPAGSIAAEHAIATQPGPGDRELLATPPFEVPVSVEPAFAAGEPDRRPEAFTVTGPSGERLVVATLDPTDLARTHRQWDRASRALALTLVALALLLACAPLQGSLATGRARRPLPWWLACAAAIIGARVLLRLASPADFWSTPLFSASTYASPLAAPLLTSPFDLLMTALAAAALVSLLVSLVEAWRLGRRPPVNARPIALLVQVAAGGLVTLVLAGYASFIEDTVSNSAVDLLHFSVHPFDVARLGLQAGLVLTHLAAVALAVAVFRFARLFHPAGSRRAFDVAAVILWSAPLIAWELARPGASAPAAALVAPLVLAMLLAVLGGRVLSRYRHGSQAFRLLVLMLAIVGPALALYPTVLGVALAAKRQLVETRYAPQALSQRSTIQQLLADSLSRVDAVPALAALVADGEAGGSDRAFQVWRQTGLAEYPVTSSVELYDVTGALVSRFAFNLPDDLTAVPRADEAGCDWTVFEEVAPFFAEERRVLHAGRNLCEADGRGGVRRAGTVVVHAMLDYANLPFIASHNPYVELLRPADPLRDESTTGADVDYAVYGWSRTPVYASRQAAWPIDDALFARVASSRAAIWTTLARGGTRFNVYLLNDRGGIYALGFPVLSALDHLVNLAELVVLAVLTGFMLLVLRVPFDAAGGRLRSGRALFRELRASFYRKLFLAFVAAAVVPVVALAVLARNYVADQLRGTVEEEAVRTAGDARRVLEDLIAPRATTAGTGIDDNLMVWASRLIDQDVNLFRGRQLQATSERNLFASGVLPTRTPADVYRAIVLGNQAAIVVRDRLSSLEYLVAAAPVRTRQATAVLTVPLTSRQQDIEAQIDALNRRVVLGALLFIIAGAGLGYSMAERIADPVNRLSRATRRIARGDLDARIAATSSDELRRLVEDFNRMASDLQRQRAELERTHRLEAWAEMARQVAHDIKNPLTPIQLNAEHLRRVHGDRGRPLGPMVDDCVATILTQVTLLRQIASEFSNFASAPQVQVTDVDLVALVAEVVDPYRPGLEGRIEIELDLPSGLPQARADRTLMARALGNLVENALHAMPGAGRLSIALRAAAEGLVLDVRDTGVGMDAAQIARAFEPYFSTKASGTGLGLPIAKRNVELSGGRISVESVRNEGTTVTVVLPAASGGPGA